jgi:hypothetical protein
MKNYEKLSAHLFMGKNFEYIKPVLDKLTPDMVKRVLETGVIKNKNSVFIDKLEYYHVTVFQKAAALISEIERLENSIIHIQKFPNPRVYEKKGIHHFSWLEYHYSYFIVTYHSLFDTALILTNAVFQLGIPERDCKSSLIKNNEWVKNTPVKAALTSLEKIVANYGMTRNLFVHRGELPDIKAITESDMLDLLKVYSTVNQHSEPIVPPDLLDNMFKYESKKIAVKLEGDIVKAQEGVSRLFDTLLPVYKKRAK